MLVRPYRKRGRQRWRVTIWCDGERTDATYRSQEEAEAHAAELRGELGTEEGSLDATLDRYEVWMRERKGNKASSAATTRRRVRAFFGTARIVLWALTLEQLRRLYRQRSEQVAADTHRNELAEVKTFLRWCGERGIVSRALVGRLGEVKGEGRRRRGKRQLRVDEARVWMAEALELAETKPGAVAALCAFLLAMRCSEIVSREVRDLDDGGRLLWIEDTKTEAGRRTLEVPETLRPHLLQLATGRKPGELLFGEHWRDWPTLWTKRICREAGVPEVSAHGMRGLHATLATDAGATSHLVAASLGHAGTAITEAAYTAAEATERAKQKRMLRVMDGGGK